MKKGRLVLSLLALVTLGFGLSMGNNVSYAKAEDEIVEIEEKEDELVEELEEEPSEEIIDEQEEQIEDEDKGLIETVKSEVEEMKDLILSVLNQPLVIGGVSITLGALVVFVLSKLIGALKTKKIKELVGTIKDYSSKLSSCVSKKDYNELVGSYNALLGVVKELGAQVKNVNVKENVNQLLIECKPIALDCKEFAVEEFSKVKEDTKAFVKEEVGKTSIADILNRD